MSSKSLSVISGHGVKMKSAILVLVVLAHQCLGFNVIDQYKDLVAKTQEEVNQKINNWIADANKSKDEAIKKIDKTLAEVLKSKQEAEEKAKSLGQQITPCFENITITSETVRQKIVDSVVGCVKDITQEIIDLGRNVTSSLNRTYNAVQDLQNACNGLSGLDSAKCILKNSGELVKATAALVAELSQAVLKITNLIANLQKRLEACIAKKAAEAVIEATKISVAIAKCAVENIKNDIESESNSEVEINIESNESVSESESESQDESQSEAEDDSDTEAEVIVKVDSETEPTDATNDSQDKSDSEPKKSE